MRKSDRGFNRDEVIRHLLFRIRKLEKVQAAGEAILEDGLAGRGKEVKGAETVMIQHEYWIRLLDALHDANMPLEEEESE